MLDQRMNIKELLGMVSKQPDNAQNFVSNLVEDILQRKIYTLRTKSESKQLNINGFSTHQQLEDAGSPTVYRSLSQSQYPAKSPSSIKPLFRKPSYSQQRLAINDVVLRQRISDQKNLEYFQTPLNTDVKDDIMNSRTMNKSSGLCSFCRQTINVTTRDTIEKSQIFDQSYKRKNLGFYNYNFVFELSGRKEIALKDSLLIKKDIEPVNMIGQKVMKVQNMKYSGVNLQSFDFDLTVSQVPKDPTINLLKERKVSELCHSQVIVSQELIPFHKLIQCADKSIQAMSQLFQENDEQTFPHYTDNDIQVQELSISKIQPTENIIDLTSSNFMSQYIKQRPCSMFQKGSPVYRPSENITDIGVTNFFDLQQISNNIGSHSGFIVPNEDKEKKSLTLSRPSQQKDFISEPIELQNTSMNNPILDTPISKIFDELDISNIEAKSHISSRSFQQNLIKQFERLPLRDRKNIQSHPQQLMSKVYDQIAILKTNNKSKDITNKSTRPPSRHIAKQLKSPPTIYQQILKGKKK